MATYNITDDLQRLCTKAELARAMNMDPRSLSGARLKPVAPPTGGKRTVPLHKWPADHLLSCVSVNAHLTLLHYQTLKYENWPDRNDMPSVPDWYPGGWQPDTADDSVPGNGNSNE